MSKYVIVCTRHKDLFFGGDVFLFWGPGRSGYTAVLQTAGLYTLEEAKSIFGEEDVPISIEQLGVEEEWFGTTNISDLRLMLLMGKNTDNKKLVNVSRESFRKNVEETV